MLCFSSKMLTKKDFETSISKKERICAFLKYLSEKYSEPLIGDFPESHRLITLFEDQSAVFTFFMCGFEDGIQGEFSGEA